MSWNRAKLAIGTWNSEVSSLLVRQPMNDRVRAVKLLQHQRACQLMCKSQSSQRPTLVPHGRELSGNSQRSANYERDFLSTIAVPPSHLIGQLWGSPFTSVRIKQHSHCPGVQRV